MSALELGGCPQSDLDKYTNRVIMLENGRILLLVFLETLLEHGLVILMESAR